ncbi:Hypothetical predicted protein [Paramuricea clavata]|uniref:Uncharacterized protein n=1 Tax=Paramuricea clavata TaxID=317549 RepID=A0A6S7HY04_PARCT|nr:Hypothetical predicted protein [Paramuricea clavata]
MGKLLDEIGVDHDGKLEEWKDNIQDYFSNIITLQKTLETLKSHKAAVEKEKLEPVIVKDKLMEYDLNIKRCERNLGTGTPTKLLIITFNIHLWLKKYNGFTRSAKVKIDKKKFYYYLYQCC